MSDVMAQITIQNITGDIGTGYSTTGGGHGSTQIPIATADRLGGIKVGENLLIDSNGVLSVDTADVVEEDNTRPITSAAVQTVVGNIDALLQLL